MCHVVPEQLERLASRRSAQAGCLGWSVARGKQKCENARDPSSSKLCSW